MCMLLSHVYHREVTTSWEVLEVMVPVGKSLGIMVPVGKSLGIMVPVGKSFGNGTSWQVFW